MKLPINKDDAGFFLEPQYLLEINLGGGRQKQEICWPCIKPGGEAHFACHARQDAGAQRTARQTCYLGFLSSRLEAGVWRPDGALQRGPARSSEMRCRCRSE